MNLVKELGHLYDPVALEDLQILYDRKLMQSYEQSRSLNQPIGIDPIEELPFPVRLSASGVESWVIDRIGTDRFIELHWERLLASPIRLVIVGHDTAGIANPGTSMDNFMIREWCADNTGTGIEDDHNHWHNVLSTIAGNIPGMKIGILRRLFEAGKAVIVGDKVLSRGSGSLNWINAGLRRTADLPYQENDFVIHINSYGGRGIDHKPTSDTIKYITDKGQVFLASSGNDGHDPGGTSRVGFPASDENAIAVGAVDSDFKRKYYSSTGPEVYSTAGSGVPCINRDGTVSTREGTSFSQPINAGIVGLIALYEGRKLTQEEVEEIIRTRSIDLGEQGRDTFHGYGIQTEETFAKPGDDPGDVDPEPPGTPTLPDYALDTVINDLTERWYYDGEHTGGNPARELVIGRLHISVKTDQPADLATTDLSRKVNDWMSRHFLVVPKDWTINQVAAITTRFIDMKMDQLHGLTVDPKAMDLWPGDDGTDYYTLSGEEIGRWRQTPEEEILKMGVQVLQA